MKTEKTKIHDLRQSIMEQDNISYNDIVLLDALEDIEKILDKKEEGVK